MGHYNRALLKLVSACLFLACAFAGSAFGQANFHKDIFEISGFGGAHFYQDLDIGPEPHLTNGSVFGGRVTENLWQHFGLEESIGYNQNQLRWDNPVPGLLVTSRPLDSHVLNANIDGLAYLTRRDRRFRPFLAAGIGGARFGLTSNANNFFQTNSINPPNQTPHAQTRGQFNYGIGVKYRVSNWFGVRADARGYIGHYPTFGLPGQPNGAAYISDGHWMSSLETTAGIMIIPGRGTPTPHTLSVSAITSDNSTALTGAPGVTGAPGATGRNLAGLNANNSTCAAMPIRLMATASDSLMHDVVYHWMVNGMPEGGNTNSIAYTPAAPGVYRIELQITDSFKKPAPPVSATAVSVYVRDCRQHSITVNPIQSMPASAILGGAALNASNSTCSATAVNLSVTATDSLGHTLSYRWTVNGAATGGNSNTLSYTPPQPGQYQMVLQVTDTDTGNPAPPMNVRAVIYSRDCARPTITCSAAPANVTLGQTAALSVTATVAQGNTARIAWTVPEGSVNPPNAAQVAYNSTGVAFPVSGQVQTKTVTATTTVTDDAGQTASCNTPIRVSSLPPTVHFGDILFTPRSARVDNRAKRVLIERLYPQLTGPYRGYQLVMVGHSDASERALRNLDRRRVLNSAAVLSANRRDCKDVELDRMRADWVGTTDTPYLEAAGDAVAPNDPRGANRRVELWLVPQGQPMPPSVKEVHPLPAPEVRALGCPR